MSSCLHPCCCLPAFRAAGVRIETLLFLPQSRVASCPSESPSVRSRMFVRAATCVFWTCRTPSACCMPKQFSLTRFVPQLNKPFDRWQCTNLAHSVQHAQPTSDPGCGCRLGAHDLAFVSTADRSRTVRFASMVDSSHWHRTRAESKLGELMPGLQDDIAVLEHTLAVCCP